MLCRFRRFFFFAYSPIQTCLMFAMQALVLPFNARTNEPNSPPNATLEVLAHDARTVRRITLDNGLTALIKEDHCAPLAAIQIWVGVGSCLEGEYLGSGLSHYLEHMVFKGTPTRKVGDITRAIDNAGGNINAFTSVDRTVFLANMPSSAWRIGLDVLADAVLNASLPEDEWQKEMEVIRREMAMNRDNPESELSRQLFLTAFRAHPIRVPIIGFKDLFTQRTRQDLIEFHRKWFAPNNMIVCIVGDMPALEAEQAIRDIFENVPRRPLPPTVLPSDPIQVSPRNTRLVGPYQLARLAWAYPGVSLDSPDAPALDVLAAVVGVGESSRLNQDIVEQRRLAHTIDAYSYSPRDPGLFAISATFAPEQETNLLAAIDEQINSWNNTMFSNEEINKIRTQQLTGCIAQLQTFSGMASSLASGEFYTGDFAYHLAYLEALNRLTPESIRDVARRYLRPERRTLAILSPLPDPMAQALPPPTPAAPVVRAILPTGLPVLLREDHRLPLVHICAVVGGGSLSERPGTAGASQLMATLLTRGAAGRSAEQIANMVESAGGSLSPFSGYNSYGINAFCLSGDLPKFMELLADCLMQPAFLETELDKQKTIQIAALRQRLESPMATAQDALRRALFPAHPYRYTTLGEETDLAALKRQDLLNLHTRTLAAGNAVLAVFGDISSSNTLTMAERFMRRFPTGPRPVPEYAAPQPKLPARFAAREPKEQAIFLMGFPGLALKDPRCDSLNLLLNTLNGLSSDLMLKIREKRGLAYFTGAFQQTSLDPGFVALYSGTRENAIQEVETLIADELARLAANGPRQDEFERARRQQITANHALLQSNGDMAMSCALDELYGLGFNRVFNLEKRLAAITTEDLRMTAAQLFLTNQAAISIVLPLTANTNDQIITQENLP